MNLAYFDTALGFAAVMLMLSMLVTILVQMAGTAVNLRGRNLHWGVQRLIERIIPEFKPQAELLAEKVLTHDALSHTLGRYAVAIRREELLLVLKDFAGSTPAEDDATGKTLKKAAEKVLEKANQANSDVEKWFDAVMDRTTERFVIRTRAMTVVFAFGLAFALHIDTPHIVKQLSSKPEVRAALVNAALNEAAPLFKELQALTPLPTEAIRSLAKGNPDQAKELEEAPALASRTEGRRWLEQAIKDPTARAKLSGEYEKQVDALGNERLKNLNASYEKVGGWLESSQLELGPKSAEYCKNWTSLQCGFSGVSALHLLGMLVTALFLSLGAPFWFNALRNLANLRPILAGKVEKK